MFFNFLGDIEKSFISNQRISKFFTSMFFFLFFFFKKKELNQLKIFVSR